MQKGGKDGWVWQNERLVLVVGDRQELAVLLLVLTRALTIKNWAWVICCDSTPYRNTSSVVVHDFHISKSTVP